MAKTRIGEHASNDVGIPVHEEVKILRAFKGSKGSKVFVERKNKEVRIVPTAALESKHGKKWI